MWPAIGGTNQHIWMRRIITCTCVDLKRARASRRPQRQIGPLLAIISFCNKYLRRPCRASSGVGITLTPFGPWIYSAPAFSAMPRTVAETGALRVPSGSRKIASGRDMTLILDSITFACIALAFATSFCLTAVAASSPGKRECSTDPTVAANRKRSRCPCWAASPSIFRC